VPPIGWMVADLSHSSDDYECVDDNLRRAAPIRSK
jgi:hypothetical protein